MQDAISKAKSLGGERITTERTEDEILLEIARFKAKLKYDTVQKYDQETLTKLIAEKKRDIEKNKSIYQNLKTSIYTVSHLRSVISFNDSANYICFQSISVTSIFEISF